MAEIWGMDPISILDSEEEIWLIRVACARVIQEDRKNQQKKKNASGGVNDLLES